MCALRHVFPPGELPPKQSANDKLELHLELATPMFGGGVEPAQVDIAQPIRPSAIRGHLRFWWRATAGAKYANAAQLFAAEAQIWGETESRSRVSLGVDQEPADRYHLVAGWHVNEKGKAALDDPAYALFVISEKDRKAEAAGHQGAPNRLLRKHQFRLSLSAKGVSNTQWDEVRLAVRAWILLGGVGARTRRGLGTLCWTNPPDVWLHGLGANSDVKPFAAALGLPPLPPDTRREWPILNGATVFVGKEEFRDATAALKWAVEYYAKFRQQRAPGGKTPGRSYWPEPEAIRNIIGGRSRTTYSHKPLLPPDPDEFPRALLGLPIVTHFKKDNPAADPDEATLGLGSGKKIGRLASPLVVKGLPVATGKARALFVMLNEDVATKIAPSLTLNWGARNRAVSLGPYRDPLSLKAGIRRPSPNNTLKDWIEEESFSGVQL
jgi:CRISPR-associated protein Cmr1